MESIECTKTRLPSVRQGEAAAMIHGHVTIAARGWTSACARIRSGRFAPGRAGRDTGGMRELQVV
ncbi:hypothetical protein JTP77_042505, partial [Streptomyces sp. S9]|nr:hypothetical protein [Streptomyces sp. S9]